MFHLYDFLIYCFITAYTPGANNLLSMSNAIRLGLRRSIRFKSRDTCRICNRYVCLYRI